MEKFHFKVKVVPQHCSQHVATDATFTLKTNAPCFQFTLHFSQLHYSSEIRWTLCVDKSVKVPL